jgi:hypothetical protein
LRAIKADRANLIIQKDEIASASLHSDGKGMEVCHGICGHFVNGFDYRRGGIFTVSLVLEEKGILSWM